MIIVKAILEIENQKQETELREVDLVLIDHSEKDFVDLIETDLADYVSEETGFCVNEIIGYKEPDYII